MTYQEKYQTWLDYAQLPDYLRQDLVSMDEKTKEDAFYGHILEFGSSKMAASPFMRPALESKAGEAINDVKKKMQQRIDKEIKRSKNA